MNPLVEWLGSGGEVVDASRAIGRANICEQCPLNIPGKWWEIAKDAIADTIRACLEVKQAMKLSVPNEESLFMCRGCGCNIRLKVWTPLKHIKGNLTSEQARKLVDHCWIRTEKDL